MQISVPDELTVRRTSIYVLGLVAALGSLAIQMFVPAMPAMSRDLLASHELLQLGVTTYLVGLSIGQIVAGPVGAQYGVRKVLIAGVAIFAVASLLAALTPDIFLLLGARFLQATGGAACLVSSRALLVEEAHGADITRDMTTLTFIMLISPVLAPVLGGILADAFGWRSIFVVLFAFSTFAGVLLYLHALKAPHEDGRHVASNWEAIFRALLAIAKDGKFRRYAFAYASLTTAMYVFLTTGPFLLDRLHFTTGEISFCLLCVALSVAAGAMCNRLPWFAKNALLIARVIAIAGTAGIVATALLLPANGIAVVSAMCLVALATGVSTPRIMSLALMLHSSQASSASSLVSATQTLASALGTALIAALSVQTMTGFAIAEAALVVTAVALIPM